MIFRQRCAGSEIPLLPGQNPGIGVCSKKKSHDGQMETVCLDVFAIT
jgi:hypothetical protein